MQWYNIIGWLAAALVVIASASRKDSFLLVLSMAAMFLFGVSYALQGVYSAAGTLFLVSIRYVLPLKFKGWKPVIVFWVFHLAATTLLYQSPLDLLTLISSLISVAAVFLFKDAELRVLMILQSSLWLTYDIFMSYTPGIFTECLYMSMTTLTLARILASQSKSAQATSSL